MLLIHSHYGSWISYCTSVCLLREFLLLKALPYVANDGLPAIMQLAKLHRLRHDFDKFFSANVATEFITVNVIHAMKANRFRWVLYKLLYKHCTYADFFLSWSTFLSYYNCHVRNSDPPYIFKWCFRIIQTLSGCKNTIWKFVSPRYIVQFTFNSKDSSWCPQKWI